MFTQLLSFNQDKAIIALAMAVSRLSICSCMYKNIALGMLREACTALVSLPSVGIMRNITLHT